MPDGKQSKRLGAQAECIVEADLLGLGYNVYRSTADTCADLIIEKDGGRPLRIEVKAKAAYTWRGKRYFKTAGSYIGEARGKGRLEDFDVLALVDVAARTVEYEPALS